MRSPVPRARRSRCVRERYTTLNSQLLSTQITIPQHPHRFTVRTSSSKTGAWWSRLCECVHVIYRRYCIAYGRRQLGTRRRSTDHRGTADRMRHVGRARAYGYRARRRKYGAYRQESNSRERPPTRDILVRLYPLHATAGCALMRQRVRHGRHAQRGWGRWRGAFE